MLKCWNCGIEHESMASNEAYIRGYKAAIEFIAEQFYNDCPEINESNPYPCEECFDLYEFVMARGGM